MSDLETYERTALDLSRIKSLALSAAKETPLKPAPALGYVNDRDEFVDVCGPHWLLDCRDSHWDEVRESIGEEGRMQTLYVLMSDGQLKTVGITEETRYSRNGGWHQRKREHSIHVMREEDIESFDFAKGRYDRDNDWGRIWGDDYRETARGPLLHARKGDGLCVLLDGIRTGQAQLSEGLIIPGRESKGPSAPRLPRLTEFHYTPDKRAALVAELEIKRDNTAAEQLIADQARQRKAKRREVDDLLKKTFVGRGLPAAFIWFVLNFAGWSQDWLHPGTGPKHLSVTTWSLIAMLLGGFVIDFFVGKGRSGAFIAGAILGLAISLYSQLSKPTTASDTLDYSTFWLTTLFGLTAYLLSALHLRTRGDERAKRKN